MHEIKLNEATYTVERSFAETGRASGLVVELLLAAREENTAFDENTSHAV